MACRRRTILRSWWWKDAGSLAARHALEALAVDGYREHRLTQKQVGELLGFSRIQAEDFLAAHFDLYDYDPVQLTLRPMS